MQTHIHAFVVVPAKGYLSESRDLLPCARTDPSFDPTLIEAQATASDLVIFTKPGCGHCTRAKAATDTFPNRTIVELPSVAARQGLASKLGIPMLTVPVVFVQGRCVGDGEALHTLLADDRSGLDLKLALPMAADPFAPGVSDTRAWTERHLFRPPGGSHPSNYFLNTYGNTVRAVSCVHVVFFVLLLLFPLAALTKILAWLIVVDLGLYVVSGNISPLALVATSLLWTRRGPVVPAIPYKVVFVFYIVELVHLVQGHGSADEIRALAVSSALNSSFLAFLRF